MYVHVIVAILLLHCKTLCSYHMHCLETYLSSVRRLLDICCYCWCSLTFSVCVCVCVYVCYILQNSWLFSRYSWFWFKDLCTVVCFKRYRFVAMFDVQVSPFVLEPSIGTESSIGHALALYGAHLKPLYNSGVMNFCCSPCSIQPLSGVHATQARGTVCSWFLN